VTCGDDVRLHGTPFVIFLHLWITPVRGQLCLIRGHARIKDSDHDR
jgi:hypothetical protein